MHFGSGQAVGALLGFNDHAVSYLWRTLGAAKVPHLVLRLVRDSHRHDLALGGFDLDVGRVDGGHDERLTCAEVTGKGLLDKKTWDTVQSAALAIFKRGQQLALKAGMILVDASVGGAPP